MHQATTGGWYYYAFGTVKGIKQTEDRDLSGMREYWSSAQVA